MADRKPKPKNLVDRLPSAPGGRPAQGFSSQRAQQWVLASALLTALIYVFRRAVEPTTEGTTNTKPTGKTAKLAGSGPPPSLGHWATSYTAAYLMLALLALAAPELAASLAMMVVLGNLLTNGLTIAADISGLEADQSATSTTPSHTSTPKPDAGGSARS